MGCKWLVLGNVALNQVAIICEPTTGPLHYYIKTNKGASVNITKQQIKKGIKFGVSTRGTGTLKENVVQNDFRLITVDIVSEPSAPKAFVEGILESKKEWILENNILVEKEIEELEQTLNTTVRQKDINEAVIKTFAQFIQTIRNKNA